MTLQRAMKRARFHADSTRATVYVVDSEREPGEFDTATAHEMDTHYLGVEPLEAVEPSCSLKREGS